ncbi:PaaX family transcriptional regulator C-terminal domain-containing protein [Actinomadura sp. 21ATH]|uniref:PaaX family transcriptional regulator C-terminal domain-containing protein n=1 Tax=Actinomadura sp. 21ATH TaxID=1735444 RepID=UPI0035BF0E2F
MKNALVRRLEVSGVTAFHAREITEDGLDDVLNRAFDITSLRDRYDHFITTYREDAERVTRPGISPAEALRLRTAVMTNWRAFPNLDPDLPAELLPPNWPRDEARRLCVRIYDSLGGLAEQRFREILAEYDPGLAELVSHHTFAQASTLHAGHTRHRTEFDENTDRDRLTMLP